MANFNFNKVILGGRLTADPELKQTANGIPVVSFTIAVSRRISRSSDGQSQQPTADFINVVAWRAQAEFITRYFRKGSSICIVGSIQTRTWTDQQNVRRYATEVIVDEVSFVDSKGDSSASGANAYNQYAPDNYNTPSYSSSMDDAPKFEELSNDDDLPF